jgi:hypothetical protein
MTIHFIATHPIVTLLAVIFIALLVALFIGGVLKSAGDADEKLIEPEDLMDGGLRPSQVADTKASPSITCAWCQKEQAIKAQPHESHGICKRHAAMMLEDARRISRAA